MVDISVIIPTLNEVGNIDAVLSRLMATGKRAGLCLEVIIVDDGSTDGTRERVKQWEMLHPVRLLARENKRGLGTAVQAGGATARGRILVVMDADLSHEPEAIERLIQPIKAGMCDMVIGSRHTAGGSTPGWPFSRRLCSRAATCLAHVLTDVMDPLSGFFAVRREVITNLPRHVPGFKIGLEILVRGGKALRVKDVPISFHDRREDSSKLCLSVIVEYLRQLKTLMAEKSHSPKSGTRQPQGSLSRAGGSQAGMIPSGTSTA